MLPTALVLILIAGAAGAAQMYRWVDKDGRVHYTDTPPPADARQGETVQSRDSSTGAASTGENETAAERTARMQRAAAGIAADRQARDRSKAEDQAMRREKDQRCQQLRNEWRKFELAGRKYVVDENNEQRNLEDKELAELEQALKEEMRKACDS